MIPHDEMRARIREKLKGGILPRDLALLRKLKWEVVREPHIVVGVVRGYPCAGCDELDPEVTYRLGDVGIRFHKECERIWNEERTQVQLDA